MTLYYAEKSVESSSTSDDVIQSHPSSSAPSPALASGAKAPPPDDASLLSVKSKLFYKKELEFIEVGVGILKVQSSSKGQAHLLMRNETSIGNVMLNVKVSADMLLSAKKNNVLLVCPTPNPPLSSIGEGPVTYLLGVKTAESAEQLLNTIKENSKDSD